MTHVVLSGAARRAAQSKDPFSIARRSHHEEAFMGSSESMPMSKINSLLRPAGALACGLLAVVGIGVAAGDLLGLNYASVISFLSNQSLPNCNKAVGARLLFWSLFMFELPLWVFIAQSEFSFKDLDAFEVRRDTVLASTKWHGDKWFLWKLVATNFALTILAWWGSYDIAYDNASLCSSKSVVLTVIDYWHLLGVNGLRALCACFWCLIIFMTVVSSRLRRDKLVQPRASSERENSQ